MCTYDAHDAVEDCKYLKKVIDHLNYSFINYYIMSIQNKWKKQNSINNQMMS